MKIFKNLYFRFSLLIVSLFACLSFLSSGIFFNLESPYISKLSETYQNGDDYIRLTKRSYNISAIFGAYSQYENLSDSDVKKMESFNDKSPIKVISFDDNNFLFKNSDNEKLNISYFGNPSTFNTKAILIDGKNQNHINLFTPLTDSSRLPLEKDEIALTDMMFEYAKIYGCVSYNSNKLTKITSPDDVIGLNVSGYKVVGVFSTPESETIKNKFGDILYKSETDEFENDPYIKNLFFANNFILSASVSSELKNEYAPFYYVKLSGDRATDSMFLSSFEGVSVPLIGIGIKTADIKLVNESKQMNKSTFFNNPVPIIISGVCYIALLVAFAFFSKKEAKETTIRKDNGFVNYLSKQKLSLIIMAVTTTFSILITFISSLIANACIGYVYHSFDVWVGLLLFLITFIPMLWITLFEYSKAN